MEARDFIELVFGDNDGYLFISSKSDPTVTDIDQHKAFKYPEQMGQLEKYVNMRQDEDLYFSPMLYSIPRRKATMVSATPVLYADTDTFDPDKYRIKPSININSSPGRTASLWLLDDKYPPAEVEKVSRAIALTHARTEDGKQVGVDAGGWDLSQLLRLAPSKNLKYQVIDPKTGQPEYPDYTEAYDVTYGDGSGEVYSMEEIVEAYSADDIPARQFSLTSPMPENLPESSEVLRRVTASRRLSELYTKEPRAGQDWSDTLYFFVSECLRAGFSPAETLVAAWHAACNKYKRDGRPMEDLWQYDVLHALNDPDNLPRIGKSDKELAEDTEKPSRPAGEGLSRKLASILLREGEEEQITRTFVDDYVDWAKTKTDAPVQYHAASALTILSCVLGEYGSFYPVFGVTRLNLFFVIMGETTATRKTTARNMMKSTLRIIQNAAETEYILTSDATGEALLDTLAERPYQSSLYDRDEAQQLIEDIKGGKGYLKGFLETLNEFYDGWAHGRLRMGKKTEDTPVNFVQYLMGIRSQIQDNLEKKDFASGWGPRNIWVRGESPPHTREENRLQQGTDELDRGIDRVQQRMAHTVADKALWWRDEMGVDIDNPYVLRFEEDAWERITDFEWDLLDFFEDHPRFDVIEPCVRRLAINIMKVAVLLAMYDERPIVKMSDVVNTLSLATQWVEDLIIVIEGVNESMDQRNIDRIAARIAEEPDQIISRAKLLRWATREGMKKREFLEYLDTLIETETVDLVETKGGKLSLELA